MRDFETNASIFNPSVKIDESPSDSAALFYNWLIKDMGEDKINACISGYNSYATDFMDLSPRGGTILELGSGLGVDLNRFQEAGFVARGIDGSVEAVKIAKKKFPNITTECQDIVKASIDPPLDGVYERLSLMYLPKEEIFKIFEKIHLALEPNGLFQCSFEVNDPQFTSWYFFPTGKKFIHEGKEAVWGHFMYLSFFQENELINALVAAHLKIIYIKYTNEPGIPRKIITAFCQNNNE